MMPDARGVRAECAREVRLDERRGEKITNPAAPVVKQTTEYRNVCAAITEKVGNKKVWRKVYRRHIERAIEELGERTMLALIAELDFRDVSYLFSTKNGMCLLDRKVEEHRKAAGRPAGGTTNGSADFNALAGELAGKWVKP